MDLDNRYKRPNKLTGKPFDQGFVDENGRVFYAYINKHGSDGYYLEEWKKDIHSYNLKKERLAST